MNHQLSARIALSILSAVQGAATVAIDFNRTHATNPSWTGHARFHIVWQIGTVVFLSVSGLLLIWAPAFSSTQCFYLASLLTALSPLGFLTAFLFRKVYGGTLNDPNGIPQLHLDLFGEILTIDMNLVAVTAALVSLLGIIVVYKQ